jgi:hypothetical protein
VDITASLLYDMKPLFPLPNHFVPATEPITCPTTVPIPLSSIKQAVPIGDTQSERIVSCLAELNAVAASIQSIFADKHDDLCKDEELIGLLINPITHRLLDRPAPAPSITDFGLILEALRLGAMIWIIWVKRRFYSYPGMSTGYVSKLMGLLSTPCDHMDSPNLSDLLSIRLWLLVLCGINSSSTSREWAAAVEMIAREMTQLERNTWAEVMARVRQMPWISGFEGPCTELEGPVQAAIVRTAITN